MFETSVTARATVIWVKLEPVIKEDQSRNNRKSNKGIFNTVRVPVYCRHLALERYPTSETNSFRALKNKMEGSADFGGGYPVILFIQTDFDKKFLCSLCHLILREPIQSFCGHRFCKGCIDVILERGLQIKCPQCEQEGIGEEEFSILKAEQMYHDNAVKREMSRIQVQCLNTGCSWQGIFKEYEVTRPGEMSKSSFTVDIIEACSKACI